MKNVFLGWGWRKGRGGGGGVWKFHNLKIENGWGLTVLGHAYGTATFDTTSLVGEWGFLEKWVGVT